MPTASDTASRLQRYIDAEAEILLNQRARFDNRELTMADLGAVQAQIRALQAQLAREQAAAASVGRPRVFGSALSNFNRGGGCSGGDTGRRYYDRDDC